MSKRKEKKLIGSREMVSLPEWGITSLRGKVDTGALSSAIDVAEFEMLPRNKVRFYVVLSRKNRSRRKKVEATVVRKARVKSSFGQMEQRLVVSTILEIGGHTREVELGLVCRKNMLCRMLLGRQALGSDFLIDPSRRYVLTERPKPKK